MYRCLIATDDEKIKEECREHLTCDHPDIEIIFLTDLMKIDSEFEMLNCLFVLFSKMDRSDTAILKALSREYPYLTLIYYSHSLAINSLSTLQEVSTIKLIVGENRQDILKNMISDMKSCYWRKIPYEKFTPGAKDISLRMKQVISYVETMPISRCKSTDIAQYLCICPGHFSQEFKREFGISFRQFMQQVIRYYESKIVNSNLTAREASRLLGYSELSSFSRAFKKRNGVSPTQYKKMVKSS